MTGPRGPHQEVMTSAERAAAEVQLRAELREAIARRAEVWELVNHLVAIAREEI